MLDVINAARAATGFHDYPSWQTMQAALDALDKDTAASAAARSAADSAYAAERDWQTARLWDYLDGRAP
jgi:hypothetical protein